MNLDNFYLKVAQKYLEKSDIKNKTLFKKGFNSAKDSSNDLYAFIKDHQILNEYELGVFLCLAISYLLKVYSINMKSTKEANNFIEKISSIDLINYAELIKKHKKVVKPIKINAITIKSSEKYLRQKSQKVDFKDESLADDIKTLEDFCKDGNVLAMAAIQLGIPKRIIYIKNTNLELVNKYQQTQKQEDDTYNEQRILINPKITKETGLTEYWEACASCLNNMGHVYRPYEIEIEYYDLNYLKHKTTFRGFESTVLSHEYDHLNGILHMDKSDEILVMSAKERGKFRQTHKYNIISKEGNYKNLLNNNKIIL